MKNIILTETQSRILEIGKEEFLKNGFKDASLRGIVKKAGFTQGAFYGYYSSKEDLFNALVEPVIDSLMYQFKKAQDEHFDLIPKNKTSQSKDLSNTYLKYFVNYIYDNFDVFKLVLCCSEGTKYASFIHDLVELDVNRTQNYYKELRQQGKLEGQVSCQLHHMVTSAYFTAVFETVVHDMKRDEALKYVDELATFFNSGWEGILKLK